MNLNNLIKTPIHPENGQAGHGLDYTLITLAISC